MAVSSYIIAIVTAWLVAHIVKYGIATFKGARLDFPHQLFISGGMPSSHAATTVSVCTLIAFKDGLEGGLFGLSVLFTLIVMYDAVKVRRSSGEQGEAIQQLIRLTKHKVLLPRAAKGHTPVEVVAGALLGCLIGYVVYTTTI